MNTLPAVKDLIASACDSLDLTQAEIAEKLEYKRPNIISMWKKGRTPIPLPRVPEIASVMNIDPAFLMKACINEYHPEMYSVLNDMFGGK